MNKIQKYFKYTSGALGASAALSGVSYFYFGWLKIKMDDFTQPEGALALFGTMYSIALAPLAGYIVCSKLGYGIGTAVSNIYDKCFPTNIFDIDVESNNRQQISETTPLLASDDIVTINNSDQLSISSQNQTQLNLS